MLRKSREFKGVVTGGTIYQVAYSMQASIASPFLSNRGFSPSQIGLLNSLSWGIIGFASMPCGRLSDAIGRRLPLILSSILGTFACILVYWSTNLFTALSLYVLIGFSIAFFTPNANALIFESVEYRKAPVFFAIFYLATLVGSSVGSFLSGWLSKNIISQFPFLAASLSFLASIPVYAVFIKNRTGYENSEIRVIYSSFNIKAMVDTLRRNKRLLLYGFSLFFHELGFFMINPYVSLFAKEVISLDMAGVGMVIAFWNIGSAVGFLPWAWATTKAGSGKMLLIHLLVSSPAWALLAFSNDFFTILLFIFIFGLVGSMDLPARRTLTAELSEGGRLGEAMGFIELGNGLSGMLGGVVGGIWAGFNILCCKHTDNTLNTVPFPRYKQ